MTQGDSGGMGTSSEDDSRHKNKEKVDKNIFPTMFTFLYVCPFVFFMETLYLQNGLRKSFETGSLTQSISVNNNQ